MKFYNRELATLSLGLMHVKKFTSFCQVLKMMHRIENWFFFLPHGEEAEFNKQNTEKKS